VAKNSFTGEILHFNATRMRITGSGNMQLSLESLDAISVSALPSIAMAAATNIEPTVLAQFIDQRGSLTGLTTEIGEYFVISRIMVYIKPIASGYPQ
jgi:hypothetical protein